MNNNNNNNNNNNSNNTNCYLHQRILQNFSATRIQNITADLWNSASNMSQYMSRLGRPNYFQNVSLLVDISPENRLYLENEVQQELKDIAVDNTCQINLNLPSNLHDMIDNSQTSITGAPDNVRNAYMAIRQLLPITVWFELDSTLPLLLDQNAQSLMDMKNGYGIEICVVPIPSSLSQPTATNHMSVYIRTRRGNEENLKRGVNELKQLIESNNYGNIFPTIQAKIDVPCNRPEIIGRTHTFLDTIGNRTSTTISVQRSTSNLIAHVTISGQDYLSISNARTEINDRFVVELTFNLNANQSQTLENFGRQLERIGEECNVHILTRPGVEPNHRTLIIRGIDKDFSKLFDVRQHVVALIQSRSTITAQNLLPTLTNSLPTFPNNWSFR